MMAEDRNLNHIAIIMDGNRRWASSRGKPSHTGHHQGASIVEEIAAAIQKEGVPWLTLFAFSSENWSRSTVEITALMTVFRHFLRTKADTLMERNTRLRIIGDMGRFDPDILERLQCLVERTSRNDGLNLTVALGYGGKSDISNAVRRIGESIAAGELDPGSVDEDVVKAHLATAILPPVDLLIRTGCEKRVSNFVLWDLAYAELVFSDTLWPDFNVLELQRHISDYLQRDRRFGGDGPAGGVVPEKGLAGQA